MCRELLCVGEYCVYGNTVCRNIVSKNTMYVELLSVKNTMYVELLCVEKYYVCIIIVCVEIQ